MRRHRHLDARSGQLEVVPVAPGSAASGAAPPESGHASVPTDPRSVKRTVRPRFPLHVALPAVAAAALALTASPADAQEGDAATDSTANLRGQVVSAMTGGPLGNARVLLKTSNRGAVTDSTGHFVIRDAPAGPDTVHVSLIGFAEQQVPLTLKPGRTTRVTLLLSKSVLKVEDITVEVEKEELPAKMAGFERRRKRGLGHFLTPEQIDQRNARQPSDLLRTVPGVSVGAHRLGGSNVRITRNAVGQCEPVYYIDGVMRQGYHIDELNAQDILAMEIYRGPSETPTRFQFRSQGCGTIVVWTEEGGV